MTKRKKTGVLMVMMENYNSKSENFLSSGRIAVGIKETVDGEKIMANVANIEYILFHTRSNDNNKHLFKVLNLQVSNKEHIDENGIYATSKNQQRYIVLEIDTDFELVSTSLLPQQIPYTPTTRYDAQYAELDKLKDKSNTFLSEIRIN